jgi:Cu+-exporting ATPase
MGVYSGGMSDHHHHALHAAETAIDPVCGMTVDPATTLHRCTHADHEYFFCAAGCRTKFLAEPERYLSGKPVAEKAAPGAMYTCPMHPEVRQRGPGSCPKCGMALEPEVVTGEEVNHELIDFTRRLWVAAILTTPLFVLEMSAHVFGAHWHSFYLSGPYLNWVQFALATPVVLWAGQPFFERGWASIRHRSLNMFTLIALGTGVAWLFSAFAVVIPRAIPAAFVSDGMTPLYFEAAAVIVTLVLVGQVLELRARERTSGAIRGLINLVPKTAFKVQAGKDDIEIAVALIVVGDLLRIKPGEKIPVDGVVVEGQGAVDQSMVTGESLPVMRVMKDAVLAGTVNTTGSFVMRATKVGAETLLSQIVHLVSQAQRSQAPIQRLADQVSAWFAPAVVIVAVLTFVIWTAVGPEPALAMALVSAVSVLIIACPCALGLATPMSIMVAVGRAAQAGLLIRNAAALERFARIDTLILDKTGTLTEGRPDVTLVRAAPGFTESDILKAAAGLERGSEHPLASAILRGAKARALTPAPALDFKSIAGKGVSGIVSGKTVLLGNAALLRENNIDVSSLSTEADSARAEGATVIYVAFDGVLAGFIAIADPIKSTAESALAYFRAHGLNVLMLTGDHSATAAAIAKKLGLENFQAEVSPQGKAAVVADLKKQGRVVAMAGDGINDAPALTLADVGVAMGTGTDIAMESAGITLLKGDIAGLVRAHKLSRATLANIRQNLFFAFAYNAAGIPLAAGVLYPFLGWLLTPAVAAAAMSVSSVSVIANALRLKGAKL